MFVIIRGKTHHETKISVQEAKSLQRLNEENTLIK
jgi:hypothetical protein